MKYLKPLHQFFKFLKKSPIQIRIIIGLILGTILGIIYKINSDDLKPYAVIFIYLISSIIVLLVLRLFKKKSLPTKIIIGMILGIVAGIVFKDQAAFLKPVGTVFIRLISLIVIPLVFVSLFIGTASMGDIKKLGRIGIKTLSYYLITTVIAIIIGIFFFIYIISY